MNIQERFKGILDKAKGLPGRFKGLKKPVRIGIIAGAAAVLVLLVAGIVMYASSHKPEYVTLFTELDQDDMAKVVTFLQENNIKDYKIQDNETILVLSTQEHAIRAGILTSGSYPASGFSYGTYLNNTGTLSSESDRTRLDLYQLQDRLGATIEQINGVKQAVVNIAEEEDNRWILNTDAVRTASAHVQVTMSKDFEMNNTLANTIRTLMANAVKGMSIENVTVADQDGKTWTGVTEFTASDSAALMMTLQTQVNETIRNNLIDLLAPLYGSENIAVGVSCKVDTSKTYEESVSYSFPDESAWNSLGGHGLIGEFVWNNSILRDENAVAGGVVGTSTNADLNEYVINEALQDDNNKELASSGSIIYENDKYVLQRESAGGVITDVTVSVGINSAAIDDSNLAAASVDALVPLVARTAGISSELENEKVAIVFRTFYSPEVTPTPPPVQVVEDWMVYALILGIALFLLLLIAIVVLRRKAKIHKAELAELAAEEAKLAAEAALIAAGQEAMDAGADIMDIDAEKSMELRQDVRKFAEENPEIAAQMLKAWLRGEEENA